MRGCGGPKGASHLKSMSMPLPESLEPNADAAVHSPRPRQMRLFQITNPITTRVGGEVFASVPTAPGVYFFYDATGKLLYIGQSLNLRARVSSYRHVSPERHPRRILRLVHRIARIEWQTCATAEAAIELERVLLLKHRPPFNRAGTWQPAPWHLHMTVGADHLLLALVRAESPAAPPSDEPPADGGSQFFAEATQAAGAATGFPLPRAIHAALCRCVMRLHHPGLPLSGYPAGLLNLTAPVHLRLPFPGNAAAVAFQITEFLSGRTQELLHALSPLMADAPGLEEEQTEAVPSPESIAGYWSAQVEMLQQFAMKKLSGPHPNEPETAPSWDQNAM